MNWKTEEKGLLNSANYSYEVLKNEDNNKYKLVFNGTRNWNKKVKVVRYYKNKPEDKNICLTVRSL